MTERRTAQTSRPTQAQPDPLAEVEAMILRLTELRQHEAGKERKADYGAAIDRLHALTYRLTEAPGRTIGLPKPPAPAPIAPAPKTAPKPPQAALPLGAGHRARPQASAALIMFCVDEPTAEAIRRALDEKGELAAVAELRRCYPLVADGDQARACVRAIASIGRRCHLPQD